MNEITKIYIQALLFSFVCMGIIFYSLHLLNFKKTIVKSGQSKKTTRFEVLEKKTVAESKPQPSENKKPQDLAPNIDSVLEGFSFGIPALELDIGSHEALMNGANDGVMSAQAVDVLPKVMSKPNLNYPASAAEKGIQGLVEVSLLVSELGQVEKVSINRSEPEGIFEAATQASVKQWRFSPAEYKGKKVAVWLNQTINFSLE